MAGNKPQVMDWCGHSREVWVARYRYSGDDEDSPVVCGLLAQALVRPRGLRQLDRA